MAKTTKMKLIGPFSQILSLSNIPAKGSVNDEQLEIIESAGLVIDGNTIIKIGNFSSLEREFPSVEREEIRGNQVLLPGFVDSHTHICFGGNRAKDFAMRLNGKSYLEIAESGGGIWSTVSNTREESLEQLIASTVGRANQMLRNGITSFEIKSGYGLSEEGELKMLRAIAEVQQLCKADVVPTFLGAHMKPRDFDGTNSEYLRFLVHDLFPKIRETNLSKRVDIFTEKSAFSVEESRYFLQEAKMRGFDLTIHADQFTTGGSFLAVEFGAKSADHLEFSGEKEIIALAASDVVATALPGASIGLGMPYAPARKLLDAGACLSIASDWNPGSAPMGDLLTQASILATYEKLSMAEVFSALTFRAAKALDFVDRGRLIPGMKADFVSFPTNDFREIIYYQGQMRPSGVWKNGELV